MPRIKQAASDLSPGDVSDYLSTPNGGLIVILEKRETLEPAEFEKSRVLIEGQALQNRSQIVFYEWLRERRHAAGCSGDESAAGAELVGKMTAVLANGRLAAPGLDHRYSFLGAPENWSGALAPSASALESSHNGIGRRNF